jgi:hypothetical protein
MILSVRLRQMRLIIAMNASLSRKQVVYNCYNLFLMVLYRYGKFKVISV